MPDPIAVRVARRHRAAVVLRAVPTIKKRVEYTATGGIYAFELAKLLEDQVGFIVRLRFRPTPNGPSTTVALEALTESGEVVTGTLVLHAAATESEITTWAVLTVNPRP